MGTKRKQPPSSSGQKPKHQKWKREYVKYGFLLPRSKGLNPFRSGQCMFCPVRYISACLAPSKLLSHLSTLTNLSIRTYKSFFETTLAAHIKQQNSLEEAAVYPTQEKTPLVMTSLQIAINSVAEEAAIGRSRESEATTYGGKKSVEKVKRIPLPSCTMKRCTVRQLRIT